MARHVRQPPPPDPQRGQADRDVHEEDPPPVGGDEQAADHGTERRGQAADRGPRADGRVAALVGRGGEDEAQGRGGEQGGARPLDDAERDERLDARRQPARGRGEGEDQHADEEPELAAASLGQPPEQHEQRREGDRVAIEHPRQARERRVEVARHLRQGDVDDEEVEAGEDHPGAHDQQDERGRGVPAPKLAYEGHSQTP